MKTSNMNGRWSVAGCANYDAYPLCVNPDYEHDSDYAANSKYKQAPTAASERYFMLNRVMMWCEAKVYCEYWGGTLASIHSAEENSDAELVCNTGRDTNKDSDACFTGLWDWMQEGTWSWIDGTPTDYGFKRGKATHGEYPWRPGYPHGIYEERTVGDGQDDKDFVAIGASNSKTYDGMWLNIDNGKDWDNTPNPRYPLCWNNGNVQPTALDAAYTIDEGESNVATPMAIIAAAVAAVGCVLLVALAVFAWCFVRNKKLRKAKIAVLDIDEEEVEEQKKTMEGDPETTDAEEIIVETEQIIYTE